MCEDTSDQESDQSGFRMSKILRTPEAVPWVLSITQAAAMLVLNLLLRVAVS